MSADAVGLASQRRSVSRGPSCAPLAVATSLKRTRFVADFRNDDIASDAPDNQTSNQHAPLVNQCDLLFSPPQLDKERQEIRQLVVQFFVGGRARRRLSAIVVSRKSRPTDQRTIVAHILCCVVVLLATRRRRRPAALRAFGRNGGWAFLSCVVKSFVRADKANFLSSAIGRARHCAKCRAARRVVAAGCSRRFSWPCRAGAGCGAPRTRAAVGRRCVW